MSYDKVSQKHKFPKMCFKAIIPCTFLACADVAIFVKKAIMHFLITCLVIKYVNWCYWHKSVMEESR